MLISLAFAEPTAPRISNFTSTTVFLNTTVNQATRRNYCAIKRSEFTCIPDVGETVQKVDKSTSFELTGLKPYTEYHCFAKVENLEYANGPAEYSPESEERIFTTKEGSELLVEFL